MSRQFGCLLLALSALAVCGLVAVCVTWDLAARTGNLPFERSGNISRSDDVKPSDPVALGEDIFSRNCSGCHSIDGSTRAGPTMQGLYGSEVTMEDGTTIVVDEDHLRTAITDPRATTREGYPDVMPAFADIDDEELSALITYIRSLE